MFSIQRKAPVESVLLSQSLSILLPMAGKTSSALLISAHLLVEHQLDQVRNLRGTRFQSLQSATLADDGEHTHVACYTDRVSFAVHLLIRFVFGNSPHECWEARQRTFSRRQEEQHRQQLYVSHAIGDVTAKK